MDGAQVLALLDVLATEGIVAWLDGGWGVDALLGEQTRPHADLDLTVETATLDRLLTRLRADGSTVLCDELPVAIALRHPDGREADLHPVTRTPDGGGDQQQSGGAPPWHYAPPVTGHVAGRPVPCNELDTQLRSHLGYPPDQDDHADMRALARRSAAPCQHRTINHDPQNDLRRDRAFDLDVAGVVPRPSRRPT